MTNDEKIDNAVHAAMQAMGLSPELHPYQTDMINDQLRQICRDILPDETKQDAATDPAPEPRKFLIIVGRDARQHYEAVFEEESLEVAMSKFSKHGYECEPETKWAESYLEICDEAEICEILDADTGEELMRWNGSEWEEYS